MQDIPRLDAAALDRLETGAIDALRDAMQDVGFLTVFNTALDATQVQRVLECYRDFFHRPIAEKQSVDMARTGANRGWGAPQSEQVDPDAHPDFKEVFDCGFELAPDHPLAGQNLTVYAPNLWPAAPSDFAAVIGAYQQQALIVGRSLLRAMAVAMEAPADSFADAFAAPMALLRGNYYPARPDWAGDKDFGIAPHTDYGCLTLLATDGAPGLEVQMPGGNWQAVRAPVGEFVINFGEMLESWTNGRAKATLHRVVGTAQERLSVPMFLNPSFDTNVAPMGSGKTVLAGDHLTRRFNETYVHLQG